MMSADPTVPDPMNAQAWNRYSYVGNDPLTFTDPSGFSWLSSFFHSVSHAISSLFNSSIIRSIVQIAITTVLSPFVGPVLAAAAGAAIVTGLSGGNLGQILRAALIAGLTAGGFQGVDVVTPGAAYAFDSPNFDPTDYVENVAGHALVGCASSVASGGSCGSGAAAAGVSAGFNPATRGLFQNAQNDFGQRIGGTLVQATVGGLASVAGGGKFANGAITGAFAYQAALSQQSGASWRDANACLEDACVLEVAGGAALLHWLLGASALGAAAYAISTTGPDVVYSKPPDNAWDPDGPKAPGYPGDPDTGHPDFIPPKDGPNWVPNPNGGGYGWESDDGSVWVPTGQGGSAHGGPHWDQQWPGRAQDYDNKFPPNR